MGLSTVVMGLAMGLEKKTLRDREKNSPFECGFDPRGSSRLPFSLRFFLIAVIFLVFDVEVVLLLPLVVSLHTNPVAWGLAGVGFLGILLLGLGFEWDQGALDWVGNSCAISN